MIIRIFFSLLWILHQSQILWNHSNVHRKKSDDRTIQSLYLKTISTIEVTNDRGLFQCKVTHTIFKMKNPAKNTCTITYAGYDMLHIRCINSNSWECNFQRSKNLKESPLEFKFILHDRWAWIKNNYIKSIYFFRIVLLRSYTCFRRSWIGPSRSYVWFQGSYCVLQIDLQFDRILYSHDQMPNFDDRTFCQIVLVSFSRAHVTTLRYLIHMASTV